MPLFPNYSRDPLTFVRGRESMLFDEVGKKYLDFGSGIGVTGLGHAHPQIVHALQKQTEELWHVSNLFANPWQERVAQKLIEVSGLANVFFSNSGAEANEAAFKLARKWGHECKGVAKPEIITFARSFHGRTLATLTATGQEKVKVGFDPLPSGFRIASGWSIAEIEEVSNQQTVAVCLELVQGEGGVFPVPHDFIEKLANWCEIHNILLIIDEIQTGMGRTGQWFAFQHQTFQPDIITLAKGLGNGFPVGAMLARRGLGEVFSPGSHGTTFGGNPLAMAVAEAVCDVIGQPDFLPSVQAKGEFLYQQLVSSLDKISSVRTIRGLGLMVGIELEKEAAESISRLREAGLIVLPAGEKVIRLLPPLIITLEQIEEAVSMIQQNLLLLEK